MLQVGDAYEQRVAKQAAIAYEERDRHRIEQETAMTVERQQQVLEAGEQLLAQCVTLTGTLRPRPCNTLSVNMPERSCGSNAAQDGAARALMLDVSSAAVVCRGHSLRDSVRHQGEPAGKGKLWPHDACERHGALAGAWPPTRLEVDLASRVGHQFQRPLAAERGPQGTERPPDGL